MLNDDNSVEEREEDCLSHANDFCISSSHSLSHQQQSGSVGSPVPTSSNEAPDFTHDPFNTVGASRSTLLPIGTANSR